MGERGEGRVLREALTDVYLVAIDPSSSRPNAPFGQKGRDPALEAFGDPEALHGRDQRGCFDRVKGSSTSRINIALQRFALVIFLNPWAVAWRSLLVPMWGIPPAWPGPNFSRAARVLASLVAMALSKSLPS